MAAVNACSPAPEIGEPQHLGLSSDQVGDRQAGQTQTSRKKSAAASSGNTLRAAVPKRLKPLASFCHASHVTDSLPICSRFRYRPEPWPGLDGMFIAGVGQRVGLLEQPVDVCQPQPVGHWLPGDVQVDPELNGHQDQ